MPKSKKPKKRYNPNRLLTAKNLPCMVDMYRLFDPIYSVLDTLENDEVICVDDVPMMEFDGEYVEIHKAMLGWADCWIRICQDQQVIYDPTPLRQMANKLGNGIPLEIDDIHAARRVIDLTRTVFMRTPAQTLRRHSVTEQIAIEFEKQHLIQAAA